VAIGARKGDDVTTEQNRNNELTVVTTDLAWVSNHLPFVKNLELDLHLDFVGF
jgi:hypothetical protein